MMAETTVSSYDEMRYPSFVHPQTHPDKLASIATLLGLNPRSPKNCRVLELGCGDGSNSIAFANSLPESEFVAIDLSGEQINYGNSIIDSIGLTNLTLRQADILNLDGGGLGKFDYVIAYGVYSWTPEPVRDKVLALCREVLTDEGIAFVSYNTLPGFYLRQMVSDMTIYHAGEISEPQAKVDEAVGFLGFLAKSAGQDELYGKILSREFENVANSAAAVTFHDDLEQTNIAVYFHQFITHAEKHGLQFLSEVEYFSAKDANYDQEKREFLRKFSDDLIRREQYIDFLNNRRFRQTLLCRKELRISKEPKLKFLKKLRICGDIRAASENCDFGPQKREGFIGKNDNQFEIDHPLTKAALVCLGEIYPNSIVFEDLVKKVTCRLDDGWADSLTNRDEEFLGEVFMQIYNISLVKFGVDKPLFSDQPGDRPLVSKLIKWQIEKGIEEVTTLGIENVKIENELARSLLVLFDGTRTREEVQMELISKTKFQNQPEKQQFAEDLPGLLDEHLLRLAAFGIFVR